MPSFKVEVYLGGRVTIEVSATDKEQAKDFARDIFYEELNKLSFYHTKIDHSDMDVY